MELTVLGSTGMRISRLCLGTMTLGGVGHADPDQCVRIVHRANAAGINFIDTADAYWGGQSELMLGRAIKNRRANLIITTKVFFPMGPDPNQQGGSRRWIVRAVEDSLRRLGTDYIDLYQMHRWDEATEIEDVLFTLTELVRQGKIRAFGSSMFSPDRLVEAQWAADRMRLLRFRTEQSPYSIFMRETERFLLPAAQRHDIGVMAFSPLDEGFLSGRYRRPADITTQSRVGQRAMMTGGGRIHVDDAGMRRKFEILPQLTELAQELGITLAQLAVAFTLEHPAVNASIIGPRTVQQLEGLLLAGSLRLPADALDRIDVLAPPGTTLNPNGDMPAATTLGKLRRPR